MKPFIYRHIFITGASSGLGAALAMHYAKPNNVLYLCGRDSARLEAIAKNCAAKGAQVDCRALDVTNTQAMQDYVLYADEQTPLDLVIANAGISAGTGGQGEGIAQTLAIFATNVTGVQNTVLPILPRMAQRGCGHVLIISSLASFISAPNQPAYCASKAAVRVWGEAMAAFYAPLNVAVTVACPGFIRTPMTAVNPFPMPFMLSADAAAAYIAKKLPARPIRIIFPKALFALQWLLRCLPIGWQGQLLAKVKSKPGTGR